GGHSVVTYDAIGNEIVRGVRNHDGTFSYVETLYTNIAGQVQNVVRPHPFMGPVFHPGGMGTTAVPFTTFAYDLLGRVTLTTLPDGNFVTNTYNGNATGTIDPKLFSRTRIVDELGRLVRVDEDATRNEVSDPTKPPPAAAVSTGYEYGPFGVLTNV